MEIISWALNAIDTLFSTRKTGPLELACRDRKHVTVYVRDSGETEDLYLFGTMITGFLLIGVGITLMYQMIKKTETAVTGPQRLLLGRAVGTQQGTISELNLAASETTHKCGPLCLGPLTFHCQAVGDMVRLSQGGRLAERKKSTFRDGLVFSSRTVQTQERIRLRVEGDLFNWNGVLRVGFTNVSPSSRSLPLPPMAIPDLTSSPGHWAAPVNESLCQAGSELEFWVSSGGSIYVSNNSSRRKLLTGVDLSQPLWAMIDIYGQTCSISLLGSKVKGAFTRRSCPAPEPITPPYVSRLSLSSDDSISCPDMDLSADNCCVVCMSRTATVLLPCGHQCLCDRCSSRVFKQFGACPLCRHKISSAPSVEGRCVSGEV